MPSISLSNPNLPPRLRSALSTRALQLPRAMASPLRVNTWEWKRRTWPMADADQSDVLLSAQVEQLCFDILAHRAVACRGRRTGAVVKNRASANRYSPRRLRYRSMEVHRPTASPRQSFATSDPPSEIPVGPAFTPVAHILPFHPNV